MWKTSQTSLMELIGAYKCGLKHILCTNISLDGTLSGLIDYIIKLSTYPDICLQASGGIHSINDIKLLQAQGLSGAIIGRALYENKFTLAEALAC